MQALWGAQTLCPCTTDFAMKGNGTSMLMLIPPLYTYSPFICGQGSGMASFKEACFKSMYGAQQPNPTELDVVI